MENFYDYVLCRVVHNSFAAMHLYLQYMNINAREAQDTARGTCTTFVLPISLQVEYR